MLPLYLLTAAKNKPILIELKSGETYNGNLTNCDSWMNLTLHNVIQTDSRGEKFMKIPEIYIRGIHIKYLRIPDDIMGYAKEQSMINMENRNRYQKRRGTSSGGGGGSGGSGDSRRFNNRQSHGHNYGRR
ncbi:U6 snRNA-associated Sm-like protein LSm4 [Candida albicans P60002]|nr:U6 snRNA-associated Sm-like protein LSm4 [Candida albicans P60002]